jgi:hypothetical protein
MKKNTKMLLGAQKNKGKKSQKNYLKSLKAVPSFLKK